MAEPSELKNIVEAALLAAGRPLTVDAIQALFHEIECPEKGLLREVLTELADDYQGRGIEVTEVASGWRIQVREACSPWVSRLWDERPARYSRALMETLALVAYRQPITRGEIEDIRGVSVSTNIIKTLMEREWVRVVGQRDVPGKPSLYGTTREFLDYFGLRSLDELPTLAELRDLDEINRELDLGDPDAAAAADADEAAQAPDAESTAGGEVAAGHDGTDAGTEDVTGALDEGPQDLDVVAEEGRVEVADADEVERREYTVDEGEGEGEGEGDETSTPSALESEARLERAEDGPVAGGESAADSPDLDADTAETVDDPLSEPR